MVNGQCAPSANVFMLSKQIVNQGTPASPEKSWFPAVLLNTGKHLQHTGELVKISAQANVQPHLKRVGSLQFCSSLGKHSVNTGKHW